MILMFFLLGAGFVVSRVPSLVRGENRSDSWSQVGDFLRGTPAVTLPHHVVQGRHPGVAES